MSDSMMKFFDQSKNHTGLIQIFERFEELPDPESELKTKGLFTTLVWASVDRITKEVRYVPYEMLNCGIVNPHDDQNYSYELFSTFHEISLSQQLSWRTAMKAKGIENLSREVRNDSLTILGSIIAIQLEGIETLKKSTEFKPTSDKGIPLVPTSMVVH